MRGAEPEDEGQRNEADGNGVVQIRVHRLGDKSGIHVSNSCLVNGLAFAVLSHPCVNHAVFPSGDSKTAKSRKSPALLSSIRSVAPLLHPLCIERSNMSINRWSRYRVGRNRVVADLRLFYPAARRCT